MIELKYKCKLCNKVFTHTVKEQFKFPRCQSQYKKIKYVKHRCSDDVFGLAEFVGVSIRD